MVDQPADRIASRAHGGPPGRILDAMRIACAECGCVVEDATVVKSCPTFPACCCAELPCAPEAVRLVDDA